MAPMKDIKLTGLALTKLYKEIGKDPALEKILVRFYEKMSQDVMIGFFFSNHDTHKIALHQKAFLLKAWGATKSYQGKAPAEAHAPLPPILAGHFDRRLVILAETLREFDVSEENIQIWVRFEDKFRSAVQQS